MSECSRQNPTQLTKPAESAYKLSSKATLVCIDIQPNAQTQAQERADILNIGGFSDQVFNLIAEFASGNLTAEHWVGVIEGVVI